ncbi:MAG: hypothetical protein U9O78_01485 [Patescibacteria group bacterium]|nr:hypothetical protein [Patescibacteria group bacterium]
MKNTVIFDMNKIIYREKNLSPNEDLVDGCLPIEEMPQALNVFLLLYEQGYKIVIISSAGIQQSRDRLHYLLEVRGKSKEKIDEIFHKIDILTMQYFGTKHSVDCWKKAMEPYSNIEYIFEDGENKIEAAGQAAKELGSNPELFISVEDFL